MQNNKLSGFLFHLSFFLFLSSLIFHLSSCKKSTEPLFNTANLQLRVLDVSCTEAWLSLRTEVAEKDSSELKLNLFRDDSLIISKPFTTADSIIYTNGLQPATTYSFSAKLLKNGKLQATSNQVTATTMDTTSHDFEWQTFEFGGQGGSSSFYDVAIIDENDIWAVGEIYTADDKYNAAHWNGKKWELRKIMFHTFCDHGSLFQYPARAVFYVNNTLLITSGSEITFIKNMVQIKNDCTPVSINKIWGTSDNDFYVVGNNGLIAHYDGRQWQRIESGTELKLLDIFGIGKIILIVGSNLFHGPEKIILYISDYKNAMPLGNYSFSSSLTSVWSPNGLKWYIIGNEVYQTNLNIKGKFEKNYTIPITLKYRIRGSSLNNIFIVGQRGLIYHFNGISWQNISDDIGLYYSVSVKENIVAIVGNRPEGFVVGPARIKIGKKE